MADRYLVVFDCVTFLQSLISEAGPAVRCLELFQQGTFSVAVSGEILSEIKEVLSRSTLRDRYPLLTDESVERLFALLRYKGNFFRKPKRHYKYLRDPGDEPYLNLCIEAQADFLVTRDKLLKNLVSSKKPQVVTPEELVTYLQAS